MKYFVLGAMASGLLLYGMSMTTRHALADQDVVLATARILQGDPPQAPVLASAWCYHRLGLAFKVGVVRSHVDPTSTTAPSR